MSQIKFKDYNDSYYISNRKVEWLIEHGNKGDLVFFKGETGDRYTIYIFTKKNHNTIDITSVWNQYSHGTDEGYYVGYIKDCILCVNGTKCDVDLDDYTLVNLLAKYKLYENTNLKLRIENIFNTSYQVINKFGTSPRSAD